MIKRTIAALILAGLSFAAGAFWADEPGPRLIAQGCLGAGGDLWAAHESDFPTECEHIEAWR